MGLIFQQVQRKRLPECFSKIRHASVRRFILRCLNSDDEGVRPSAAELLADPFLQPTVATSAGVDNATDAPGSDVAARGANDGDLEAGAEGGVVEADEDESFNLVVHLPHEVDQMTRTGAMPERGDAQR